jgi:CDP-glucose 4,6-dehydratase
VENLELTMFGDVFRAKRVLVTGHTGFKGAWLCEWLLDLGAEVTGYSLPPPTHPALFEQLGLARRIHHRVGDIRDPASLHAALQESRPHFVFHLAAQSLVRTSYAAPAETFATNVMGTVNLLEALRRCKAPCEVVIATTDKCYENIGQGAPFAETERLGGRDPYSASKACAEIAAAAYRESYFCGDSDIGIATARAGNVLGGGDWAADRIVPDCVRALSQSEPVIVRHPDAVRPWQHVLECLSGYLSLAQSLASARAAGDPIRRKELCSSFNFGPRHTDELKVRDLVERILTQWPGKWIDGSDPSHPHESARLQLSIAKAELTLGWRPAWGIEQTIANTISWYQAHANAGGPLNSRETTLRQIRDYAAAARTAGLSWAR